MAQAENGNTVEVHYTGRFEDGTVCDSSTNTGPMQFVTNSSGNESSPLQVEVKRYGPLP
jgi:peptidylprolyl isomerase